MDGGSPYTGYSPARLVGAAVVCLYRLEQCLEKHPQVEDRLMVPREMLMLLIRDIEFDSPLGDPHTSPIASAPMPRWH